MLASLPCGLPPPTWVDYHWVRSLTVVPACYNSVAGRVVPGAFGLRVPATRCVAGCLAHGREDSPLACFTLFRQAVDPTVCRIKKRRRYGRLAATSQFPVPSPAAAAP
jgi:hypothetical protein